jgi:1-acyl-sn-glycerol-3-phosphate acyltransferase
MASTPDARDARDRAGTPRRWWYEIVRLAAWIPLRLLFRLHVEGVEHVPAGGAIIAPTHRSNFDSLVVGVALRGRMLRFMAKAELYRYGPLAWILRSAGAFKVERGKADTDAVAMAIGLARAGALVCVFPEGTRNRDGRARPHSGAARITMAAGVPMVPVLVSGTDRVRLFPPRLPRFVATFAEPIAVDDLGELDERWRARRITERWEAAIARLAAGDGVTPRVR